MTAQHSDPLFRRNSRLLRKQVRLLLARDGFVLCWRCGNPIHEGQHYDIGHLVDARLAPNHDISNLAPEHRKCNRSAGGKAGQALQARARSQGRFPQW